MTWPPPQIGSLPDDRLHLQHGPIDLVIKAAGSAADVKQACAAAVDRFRTVLGELAAELPELRKPLGTARPAFASPIANRMAAACRPHRAVFITPMAAVAGSVADEIAAVMLAAAPGLRTFYVNNGGDIAVHAADGETLRIGVVPDLARAAPEGVITVTAESGIKGIATSGWRGRSFSLGVADAVTVLAGSAATADAAATIIANAIDITSPAVRRAPARSLDPDSDLGDLPVTTDVGSLAEADIAAALAAGAARAQALRHRGLILGCMIVLQGRIRILS